MRLKFKMIKNSELTSERFLSVQLKAIQSGENYDFVVHALAGQPFAYTRRKFN